MSVCFSGSLLSASVHCIHCNISIAQKINFDRLIVRVLWGSLLMAVYSEDQKIAHTKLILQFRVR